MIRRTELKANPFASDCFGPRADSEAASQAFGRAAGRTAAHARLRRLLLRRSAELFTVSRPTVYRTLQRSPASPAR